MIWLRKIITNRYLVSFSARLSRIEGPPHQIHRILSFGGIGYFLSYVVTYDSLKDVIVSRLNIG